VNQRSHHVLIHRLGSLGDTIVALPAFHWIRHTFPASRITLLTSFPVNGKAPPTSTVLESTGLVDDYLEYPLATRNPKALLRLHREIRRRGFDIVFALAESQGRVEAMRDWLFFRSCGVAQVIGSPLHKRDLAYLPATVDGLYEPEAQRLIRRVGAESKVDLDEDRWWDLRLTATETGQAAGILMKHQISKFIGLSIGTKMDVKDWTFANWRLLVRQLASKYPQLGIVGIGAAEERQNTDAVLQLWPGPTLNVCGMFSPRTSAALLQRAAVFVGHDSGPMHLAAAVGTKCVAIFSARVPPGVWFPRGRGHRVIYHRTECFNCRLSVCPHHQKKCILSISVDEVIAAVEQVLQGRSETEAIQNGYPARQLVGCQ
jgi:ADP-heptose:LPS heptosyltransferase